MSDIGRHLGWEFAAKKMYDRSEDCMRPSFPKITNYGDVTTPKSMFHLLRSFMMTRRGLEGERVKGPWDIRRRDASCILPVKAQGPWDRCTGYWRGASEPSKLGAEIKPSRIQQVYWKTKSTNNFSELLSQSNRRSEHPSTGWKILLVARDEKAVYLRDQSYETQAKP